MTGPPRSTPPVNDTAEARSIASTASTATVCWPSFRVVTSVSATDALQSAGHWLAREPVQGLVVVPRGAGVAPA